MNVSIITSYGKSVNRSEESQSKKIKRVLLELAEKHLQSPDTSHLISRAGVEKVRRKLAS